MSETVWVNQGRNRSVYHTKQDCDRGPSEDRLNERSKASLRDDLRECAYCAGTASGNDGGDRSIYEAALQAGKADD